jgi:hypothetical protein
MSLSQDYLDRWLQLDVESYFKGHEPRSIELARAPLLNNRRVNLVCERFETPSVIVLNNAMSLSGHVTGHPERADGELVTTTRLVWLDRHGKWARTKQRLYRLGDRSNAAERQQ